MHSGKQDDKVVGAIDRYNAPRGEQKTGDIHVSPPTYTAADFGDFIQNLETESPKPTAKGYAQHGFCGTKNLNSDSYNGPHGSPCRNNSSTALPEQPAAQTLNVHV